MNQPRSLMVALGSATALALAAGGWYGFGRISDSKPEVTVAPPRVIESRKPATADAPPPVTYSWGSLTGRVTWRGEVPAVKSLDQEIRMHAEAKLHLNAPEEHLRDPTWQIEADTKGVRNVVVFLTPLTERRLPIHPDDKNNADTAVLDVPYCNYVPHVSALYPEWRDETGNGRTGQRFFITCSSKQQPGFMFGFKVDELRNQPVWTMMAPGQKTEIFVKSQATPMTVQAPFHPWMKAYVWVFDHPYFAVTKRDGSYSVPRVPAGIELRVMMWHEARSWLHGKNGKVTTLTLDENRCDAELRASD